MANIILKPGWTLPESSATSQSVYKARRDFVKRFGLGAIAFGAVPNVLTACDSGPNGPDDPLGTIPANAPRTGLPATRNAAYEVPEREITDRILTATYNNFYEFDLDKKVWHLTGDYEPFPMTIKVDGLVENELEIDLEELMKTFGLEERLYRFRCVEAWAMTVPWTGFPLAKLIEYCKPLSKATHVKFVSANRPDQMPGMEAAPWYPWPYFEGLRMDEATNELAFMATGLYGEPLPKQSGSPVRMVLPWKYGYKGAKAINRITFMDKQPATFWNDLQPSEYPFLSNVNPGVPHPRWSQATERLLNDGRRVPTQLFNGYEEFVGAMYPDESRN